MNSVTDANGNTTSRCGKTGSEVLDIVRRRLYVSPFQRYRGDSPSGMSVALDGGSIRGSLRWNSCGGCVHSGQGFLYL